MEDRPLDDTDDELVERARRGDVAAYEAIVRRFQEAAFRVAYAILGSASEAEDAAQEGFIRAYRSLHRFRAGSPFRPWLVTIVANVARTQGAAAARHPAFVLDDSTMARRMDPDPSPEAAVLAAEARGELLSAVNAMREDDRQVLVCRFFLGLSESETAAVVGCAPGTVKSRTSRALGRLRERLRAEAATVADGVGRV